jgi:hypothetical protein
MIPEVLGMMLGFHHLPGTLWMRKPQAGVDGAAPDLQNIIEC